MRSETIIVAEQCRFREWTAKIRDGRADRLT